MDQLLPVMNKLQDVFNDVGMNTKVDLPQIVVVGSQSSGKSSVLEALVGRDFLPRGTGIVTRRPLVLQLNNTKEQTPWGEFNHQPGRNYTDFAEIRNEIIAETARVCGDSKNVNPMPISLKIHSPHVLPLTLVDLPGMTEIAVEGQPSDIAAQIREMVLTYIRPHNSIILAVSAANSDIATSSALRIAREVDPQGDRTLGVLTKLDLMDEGTDASDVLSGKVIPLRRDYVGVKCRSQKDIDAAKDIRQALKDEEDYFSNHPAYRPFAQRMGSRYLGKELNVLLLNHIRNKLPELKKKITDLIARTHQVLQEFGGAEAAHLNEGGLLLDLLTRYVSTVQRTIDGTSNQISKSELYGGARINWIFNHRFGPYISSTDPTDGVTEQHIRNAIDNAKGPRSTLFIPDEAFELLVKEQIAKLEEPCQRCAQLVFEELIRICEKCEKEVQRFPILKAQVSEAVQALLRDYMGPLRDYISSTIQIQLSYINTNHPHFSPNVAELQAPQAPQQAAAPQPPGQPQGQGAPGGAAQAHYPAQQQGHPYSQQQPKESFSRSRGDLDVPTVIRYSGDLNTKEKAETDAIKQLLTHYFSIVQIQVKDLIPKAIIHFMVNRLKGNLQNHLVATFYKETLFSDLLKESDDVAARRKAAQAMLSCLTEARDALTEIRDFRL